MSSRLQETALCRICGDDTYVTTKLCGRCWELESRIKVDPLLAEKILSQLLPEDDPLKEACKRLSFLLFSPSISLNSKGLKLLERCMKRWSKRIRKLKEKANQPKEK